MLFRSRNSHPAFDGQLSVDSDGTRVRLAWTHGTDALFLDVDMATAQFEITDGSEAIVVAAG